MCDCSKDVAAIEAEQCRLIANYIPRYLEEQRIAIEVQAAGTHARERGAVSGTTEARD